MFKALFFCCSLFLVSFMHLNAQTKIIVHENTTQPGNKTNQKTKRNTSTIKNAPSTFLEASETAFKINISPLFRSDYCLSFEKKVHKYFSAELTGGITYYDRLFESLDVLNYRPYNMVNAGRQHAIGPSVKIGGRYYMDADDEEICGPYLNMELMYRRYNSTIRNNYTTPVTAKEYNDHKEIRALFGWQGSDWSEFAFYDIAVGVGYRMHERKYLGYTDMTNYSSQDLLIGQKNYLIFLINFKIGFLLFE